MAKKFEFKSTVKSESPTLTKDWNKAKAYLQEYRKAN
jgi:hypothetical protein